jgi:hypothetical protein
MGAGIMKLPPLPRGFVLLTPAAARDPWDRFGADGFFAARLRRPLDAAAARKRFYRGDAGRFRLGDDAADFDPPSRPDEQAERMIELFDRWPAHERLHGEEGGGERGWVRRLTPDESSPDSLISPEPAPPPLAIVRSEVAHVQAPPAVPNLAPSPSPPSPAGLRGIQGVLDAEPRPYRGSDGSLVPARMPPPPPPPPPSNPTAGRLSGNPIIRRDDPRLAGVNDQFRAMYADPGISEGEMAAYLADYGITPAQIANWRRAMNWRRTPEFRSWRATPASRRDTQIVDLQSIVLPAETQTDQELDGVVITVRRRTHPVEPEPPAPPLERRQQRERWLARALDREREREAWIASLDPVRRGLIGAEVRPAPPPTLSRRISRVAGKVFGYRQGRYRQQEMADRTEALLDWTPIGNYDDYQRYGRARDRAIGEGRYADAAGNFFGQAFSAVTAIAGPLVGLLRRTAARGGREAVDALLEIRRTAARLGEDASGRDDFARHVADNFESLSDDELARFITARWDDLTGVTRNLFVLRAAQASRGSVGAGDVQTLRRVAESSVDGGRVGRVPDIVVTTREISETRPDFFVDASRLADDPPSRLAFQPSDESLLTLLPGPADQAARFGIEALRGLAVPRARFDVNADLAGIVARRNDPGLMPDSIAEWSDPRSLQFPRPRLELRRGGDGDVELDGQSLAEGFGNASGFRNLVAPPPAATAYEDLAGLPASAADSDLTRVESSADIARLVDEASGRFTAPRDPRQAQLAEAEAMALADELGIGATDLLRPHQGRRLNAEQVRATRRLLHRSSGEIARLAEAVGAATASDADRAAFVTALFRHAAIQDHATGSPSRAGRVLSAISGAARSGNETARMQRTIVDEAGGRPRIEKIAEGVLARVRDGADAGTINRFATEAVRPRFVDKLVELRANWRTAQPRRLAAGVVANSSAAGLQLSEHMLAAGFGQVERGYRVARGLADTHDRMTLSELTPRIFGMVQGAKEGLRSAGGTLRTGEVFDPIANLRTEMRSAISGPVGTVIRTPFRIGATVDELAAAATRRSELNALAMRQARAEGLRGEALRRRAAEIAANPPPPMLERALDRARYATFQQPLPGRAGELERSINRRPWLKLIVPQIRRPTNVLRFALERSPLAPALKEVRQNLAAGGERRHVALARISFGTAIGTLFTHWADEGVITGAPPPDHDQRLLLTAGGWQPYSIRIGDTYFSYEGLGPLSATLRTAAELARAAPELRRGQAERLGAEYVADIVGNLGEEVWLADASALVAAIENPERNLKPFAARMAEGVLTPPGLGQIAGTIDPVEREARTPQERIQARIPGLSDDLPARRDLWGRELPSEPADSVWPIRMRRARDEAVTRELLDLGVRIGPPPRQVSIAGEHRMLDDTEYARFQELAGRLALDELEAAMASAEWRSADVEIRRNRAEEIVGAARADALRSMAPRLRELGRAR